MNYVKNCRKSMVFQRDIPMKFSLTKMNDFSKGYPYGFLFKKSTKIKHFSKGYPYEFLLKSTKINDFPKRSPMDFC